MSNRIPGIPDKALEKIAAESGALVGWYLDEKNQKRTEITIAGLVFDSENNTAALIEVFKWVKNQCQS